MRQLFDKVSYNASKVTTTTYSTSFSLGIYCLNKQFRKPVYNIYGLVRFADEIVDTFHEHNKAELLKEFKEDTFKAIDRRISLNPILNSFQEVVHSYNIDRDLIHAFFRSMETDLNKNHHSENSYEEYIYGSAEVVGLMCLKVFTNGNSDEYERLKPAARKLGAAFQKVNFLRDMKEDYQSLGRVYFPSLDLTRFRDQEKQLLEKEIEFDFNEALKGIRELNTSSRFGVFVAYTYYKCLFNKIKATPSSKIMSQRIRVPNYHKISLLLGSWLKHAFKLYDFA